jgi:hypothetical protein
MASNGEGGGSDLPSPRKHETGALPAPIMTKCWLEDIAATLAMMIIPLWALALWSDTGHSIER